MKQLFLFSSFTFFSLVAINAQNIKVLAECTVSYSIQLQETNTTTPATEATKNATKTLFIKGNQSRVDLVSPSFSQSIIFDKALGNAVILREIGNNKFITKLDNAKWKGLNAKFEGLVVKELNEKKVILGYECKKAILELKDGSAFTVYYATSIIPSVKEFEYQFKDIPGFVLEYESQEQNGQKVKYIATTINLNPVSINKFDIPTSGFRVLN